MIIKCKQCGKKFSKRNDYHKYCSSECRRKYWYVNNVPRVGSKKRNCKYCNKEFIPEYPQSKATFCSQICKKNSNYPPRSIYKPKGITIECNYCGVKFTVLFMETHGYGILTRRKYCSRKCAVRGSSKKHDEGWRLEIPGLPELTGVGARRGHTLDSAACLPPAYGSGPDIDRPFGSGLFSKADYIEILRFANARHIELIPEIEMPGPARAAIKSMDARFRKRSAAGDAAGARQYLLSEAEDKSVYKSVQDFPDNVMNPALESTYAFVEKVVEGLVATHAEAGVPLRNLHMGGDEVPAGVWEKSPSAVALMKAKGLASVDDLWFVFYERVEEVLKRHGIPLSGWEEIGVRKTRLDGRPEPQAPLTGPAGQVTPSPLAAGRVPRQMC